MNIITTMVILVSTLITTITKIVTLSSYGFFKKFGGWGRGICSSGMALHLRWWGVESRVYVG